MSSLYHLTGVVPASSGSESGSFNYPPDNQTDGMEISFELDGAALQATPPKKSILRDSSVRTPCSEKSARKSVKFARKSLSLNLSPACSPAYYGRSICREDMANMAFCLERSRGASRENSPTINSLKEKTAVSSSPVTLEQAPSSLRDSKDKQNANSFELSTYINKLDMLCIISPSRKSASATSLNKLGLSSTPTTSTNTNNRGCGLSSPETSLFRSIYKGQNYFGTPKTDT